MTESPFDGIDQLIDTPENEDVRTTSAPADNRQDPQEQGADVPKEVAAVAVEKEEKENDSRREALERLFSDPPPQKSAHRPVVAPPSSLSTGAHWGWALAALAFLGAAVAYYLLAMGGLSSIRMEFSPGS